MARRRGGTTRTEVQREADLVYLLELWLKERPRSEMERLINERHVRRRFEALVAAGTPPDEARRRADEDRLSERTIAADRAEALRRLRGSQRELAVERVDRWLDELTRERQKLFLAERELWAEWERLGEGSDVETVQHFDVKKAADGSPVMGADGQPALLPRSGSRRTTPRRRGAALLGEIAKLSLARLRIFEEIMRLEALRDGVHLTVPDLAAALADPKGGQQLIAGELERMYRADAVAAGVAVDPRRLQLVSSAIDAARVAAGGGGKGSAAAPFHPKVRLIAGGKE